MAPVALEIFIKLGEGIDCRVGFENCDERGEGWVVLNGGDEGIFGGYDFCCLACASASG